MITIETIERNVPANPKCTGKLLPLLPLDHGLTALLDVGINESGGLVKSLGPQIS